MITIIAIFASIFLFSLVFAPPIAFILLIGLGAMAIISAFFPTWWKLINEP